MSIDWITVGAQLANFLVLVWLLKRFLYRPILDGINAREKEIAERMAEADRIRERSEVMATGYQNKLDALQAMRGEIADTARGEAERDRDTLLTETRQQLQREKADWEAHLAEQARRYEAQLHATGGEALLEMTRKALTDLAGEDLEARIASEALRRFRALAPELRTAAAAGAETVVCTRDPLPGDVRDRLAAGIAELVPGIALRFETDPGQPPGLVLQAGAARVDWTIESYVEGLREALRTRFATVAGTRGHGHVA